MQRIHLNKKNNSATNVTETETKPEHEMSEMLMNNQDEAQRRVPSVSWVWRSQIGLSKNTLSQDTTATREKRVIDFV